MMRENSPPQLVAASLALGTKQFPAEWDGEGREGESQDESFFFPPQQRRRRSDQGG